MKTDYKSIIGIILAGLLSWPVLAFDAEIVYNYTTIDFPSADITDPYGINNAREVVGDYLKPGETFGHGFLFSVATFTTIDVPGATFTRLYGINDAGQIVGYSFDPNNGELGFLFDAGTFTTIRVPGIDRVYPMDINNFGDIVGFYYTSEGNQVIAHGFSLRRATFTIIDVPGADSTYANGINDKGQIVGHYLANGFHSFLLDEGIITTLDIPNSFATGINDAGQIVGGIFFGNGFLLDADALTIIHVPGAGATVPIGINDIGQIVGYYTTTDTGYKEHGFVAEKKQPPVASFTYTPENPRVGEEITFDASSSYDPDGTIVSYQWDFSDGSGGEGQKINHAYNKAGEYTVTLTVKDNGGLMGTAISSLKIKGKEFMITFDDGPFSADTKYIVDQINDIYVDGKPVKAGFFMVGCDRSCQDTGARPIRVWGWLAPYEPPKLRTKGSVRGNEDIVRYVASAPAGHIIGNHTQHHMWFWWGWPNPSEIDVRDEIAACNNELQSALAPLGKTPAKIFRPPYFVYNSAVQKGAASLGFKIIMGAGENRDKAADIGWPEWLTTTEVKQKAKELIESWERDEPCVLVFHDFTYAMEDIKEIIRYLREDEGFTLVHFDPDRISEPTSVGTIEQVLSGVARSPVDLGIIDPDFLILSKEQNLIPDSLYQEFDIDGNSALDDFFAIHEPKAGDYLIRVIPEPDASPTDTYSLEVAANGVLVTLAEDVQVKNIPAKPYIVRSTETGTTPVIPATIDFDPDTLNLGSEGKWVTVYIELPVGHGYDVTMIDLASIMLNDQIELEAKPIEIGDYDGDDIPDLMVKFDREELIDILDPGEQTLSVTGCLTDGRLFAGTDQIRVISPP